MKGYENLEHTPQTHDIPLRVREIGHMAHVIRNLRLFPIIPVSMLCIQLCATSAERETNVIEK